MHCIARIRDEVLNHKGIARIPELASIGTDHDIEKIASSLSINITLAFEKNEEDIKAMFSKERDARTNFSRKIEGKENLSSNYFDEPKSDKNH